MAPDTPITIAFAGSGDVDFEVVKDLLNDFLGFGDEDKDGYPAAPDRTISLIFPLTREHLTDAVQEVLKWTDYADMPYLGITDDAKRTRKLHDAINDAEDYEHASNVNAKLIDHLVKATGEKYLLLAWGDSDEGSDKNSETLLDLATAAGIPVKDLTKGLDDIVFTDPDAVETPVVPEPEQPRRRGRKTQVEELSEPEEPLTDDEPAPPASLAEAPADLPHDRTDPALAGGWPGMSVTDVLNLVHKHLAAVDEANAAVNLAPVQYRPLTRLVREFADFNDQLMTAFDAVASEKAVEAPQSDEQGLGNSETPPATSRRSRGRPRRDGSPAQPRTEDDLSRAFNRTADVQYRTRGRGRTRAGEEIVMLTPAQIREYGLDED